MRFENQIVVGLTLDALIYAFKNNLTLLHSREEPPHRFEYFEPDEDLSTFGIENLTSSLVSDTKTKHRGIEKRVLWDRLIILLSLAGKIPLSGYSRTVRFDGNTVDFGLNMPVREDLEFDEAIIFSDKGIDGLPTPIGKTTELLKVIDWFDIKKCMKHDFDYLETGDDFLKDIIFYSSDRISGNTKNKDAVTFSYLTPQQLEDEEYSDVNARFKLLYLMKQAGIKGAFNGWDVKNPKLRKNYKLKAEFCRRDVEPLGKNIYKDERHFTFINEQVRGICLPPEQSYLAELLRSL